MVSSSLAMERNGAGERPREAAVSPNRRRSADQMKPLLKWAGGKRSFTDAFAPVIRSYLAETEGHYIEPFVGGGAMALAVQASKAVLSDKNDWLMAFYATVRDAPKDLYLRLRGFILNPGVHEKAFYQVRELELEEPLDRAAQLLYLNKLCFNGLFRVNKSGKFNAPFGDSYKKLPLCGDPRTLFPKPERLEEVSKALKNAYLTSGDFETVIENAGDGDLLYVDPPYDGTYGSYTADGFTDDDQKRLAAALYYAHKRGAKIVFHNANTERIQYFYHEWLTVYPVDERRAINCDGNGRSGAKCLVATNLGGLY